MKLKSIGYKKTRNKNSIKIDPQPTIVPVLGTNVLKSAYHSRCLVYRKEGKAESE
jgi:hypothetical protein